MDFTIDQEQIRSFDLSIFKGYHMDEQEFFGSAGQQHYKLLGYISTLFNDTHIIDIGTHMGSSAMALSYNKRNKVHTFDIVNKTSHILNSYRLLDNVEFHIADVFTPETRAPYRELLLSAPFVFIDVDPHNGWMEWDIYTFFRDAGYKGILFFDDIHYFEGMRQFWSRVDNKYKHDLTKLGHFSGSGLVIFNPEIKVKLV